MAKFPFAQNPSSTLRTRVLNNELGKDSGKALEGGKAGIDVPVSDAQADVLKDWVNRDKKKFENNTVEGRH